MSLNSAYAGLQRLIRGFAMVALVGLVGVTAVDVLGRVLFNAPLGFAYELIGILLGAAVYGGLVGLNWDREHIRIDLLENLYKKTPRFDAAREMLCWVLELAFFTLLAIYIFRQAFSLMRWKETFLFLSVEKWVPVSLFGLFAALAVISTLTYVLPALRRTQEDQK